MKVAVKIICNIFINILYKEDHRIISSIKIPRPPITVRSQAKVTYNSVIKICQAGLGFYELLWMEYCKDQAILV